MSTNLFQAALFVRTTALSENKAHLQSNFCVASITYCMSISCPSLGLIFIIIEDFRLNCSIFTFAFLLENERNERHYSKVLHFAFLSTSFASFSFTLFLLEFLSDPDEAIVSCNRNTNHLHLTFSYGHCLNTLSPSFELC